MDDTTRLRKQRLRQAIESPPFDGRRDLFMRVAKLTKGRISQLLDPAHPFGERAGISLAKKLAERYPQFKDERWFERDSSLKPSSDSAPTSDVNESHAAGDREKVAPLDPAAEQNTSSRKNPPTEIPTKMHYEPRHLKNAILLMGNLLGALDVRSKKYVGDMLQELALKSDDPDEIEDIANKASSVANVQKPVTKNAELAKSIRGRGDAVETNRAPLEH